MKIIEIKTVEDFEQLRKLNKKESVLLKIYDPMSKVQLSSIDLKGFRGRITVSFQNSKHPYYFNVIVENENGNTFIFSNVNSSIIYLDQGNMKFFIRCNRKSMG